MRKELLELREPFKPLELLIKSLLLTPYRLLPASSFPARPAFLAVYCLLITFFSLASAGAVSAGVTVFDTVVTVNKDIKLKSLTKGRFFPEGGKLVTFSVDSKKIGTTLSGGDGYAFMKYTSSSRGIKMLKVKSGEDTDQGVLLITGKNEKVVLVEIENTLFESIMVMKPSSESKDALQKLSEKFRIIYLTRMFGISASRQWIGKHNLPVSAVLKWEGTETLSELQDRGIKLYAIIGPADLLSEASEIEKRFSFNETDDATEVDDWDELQRYLEP